VSVPDKDSVIITYSGPVTEGNTISIMTCFSNSSSMDRAWRKANAIIGKDKQCNVEKPMVKGLPTGEGTYTWTPGELTTRHAHHTAWLGWHHMLALRLGAEPPVFVCVAMLG
jgi:hypothetical protein